MGTLTEGNAGGYRGASLNSQETYAWRPPTLSADAAALPARERSVARVEDLVRNDPHAVAGVARLVDMLVGAGISITSNPDARALGFDMSTPAARSASRKKARDIGVQMENEFWRFANDPLRRCDAQRRTSLNGLFRLFGRTFVRRGEVTYFLDWKPQDGGRFATCVRAIDPDRVCNPMGASESPLLRGGIEFTRDGVPVAYHVRSNHPGDHYATGNGLPEWVRIPRYTNWGRPVFVHGFEPERENQARAVTPFAALMTRLRMIGKFADTELASATVNALFAAYIKSNLPAPEVAAALTPQGSSTSGWASAWASAREEYYEEVPPQLNGVRVPVLPPGDEFAMQAQTRTTSGFPAFQTSFLQSIAAALGISYEQLAGDWSNTNYSSARAALNEVWRHVRLMSAIFSEQVVFPVYFAVMEEAFDQGYIKLPAGAPEFHEAAAAYLNMRTLGPGRGYVDETKEAEGASMRMDSLISTLDREIGAQGEDWEEVLDQIALENEALRERGLTRMSVTARQGNAGGAVEPNPGNVGRAARVNS